MSENDVYVVGKDKAITSLVLGLVSILSCFTGVGAVIGLVTGIIGVVFANKAKKEGYLGGLQTAGFVSSLVGLIISAVTMVLMIIFIGSIFNLIAEATTYGMYTWY